MNSVERARELIDVPHVHLGRDVNGIDCIGLVAYAVNYDAERLPPYPADPINGELERYLEEALGPPTYIRPESAAPIMPGDIVAMQYAGPVRHVGLVAEHPTLKGVLSLIHTDRSVGRVVECTLDSRWLRRIVKGWRA